MYIVISLTEHDSGVHVTSGYTLTETVKMTKTAFCTVLKFRSKVMLLKLGNAQQGLFYAYPIIHFPVM